MSDHHTALAELAESVGRGDDGSLESERAVQLRAVEPLLETLDWDVRGPAVVPEADVEGETVDYLLEIDDTPAVAVRTADPDTDSLEAVVDEFESVLTLGELSRGIVTDGRSIVLLAIDGGEVHRRSVQFRTLPEHATALGQFHRLVLAEVTARDRADRAAAQRLAANRDAVEAAVTEEIVAVTGTEFEDMVAAESERTVDALLEALHPDAADADSTEQERSTDQERSTKHEGATDQEASIKHEEDANEAERTAGAEGTDAPGATSGAEGVATDQPADGTGTSDQHSSTESTTRDAVTGADEASADGEYVVRFFGGASSVGAVGTQSPAGTVLGVVRYLLENHDLESSLTLPWQLPDGTTILAATGESPEWTTLENAHGETVAVRSIDDPSLAKDGIEALADATGLRVMFQGDW